jgi:uncharacterized protein (TIGR03437 family)
MLLACRVGLAALITLAVSLAADSTQVQYSITTLAGSTNVGDGGPAPLAVIVQAEGIAADTRGNLYVADAGDHRVRKILPDGSIRTIAGNGFAGFRGDGGPGDSAQLNTPYGICVDRHGNVFVADLSNARVRRIAPDGKISTVAGGGAVPGIDADGTLATDVKLLAPRNVAVDADGNLYISDFSAHRVYKVSTSGVLVTVAGSGASGFAGDGALANRAKVNYPAGLAIDRSGALYIADSANRRIRKVTQGIISSLGVALETPTGLAIDKDDNLLVADGRASLMKVSPSGGFATLPIGGTDVAVDGNGSVFTSAGRAVRKLANGVTTVAAGTGLQPALGDGGPGSAARLNSPFSVALDAAGNLYIADAGAERVRRVTSLGIISTFAGGGSSPFTEGAQAAGVKLSSAKAIVVDSKDNVYVADTEGHRIYRVTPNGTIITIAGTGEPGGKGDDGPSALAQLNRPLGLAIDRADNLYVADSGNHRVRRITPTFFITTVAGSATGEIKDEIPATSAKLVEPSAVAVDDTGNVYIAETSSNRIRLVDGAGLISTFADSRTAGLYAPRGLKVAADGSLLVCDSGNHRIRRIYGPDQVVTVAGTGTAGFNAETGLSTETMLNTPMDLTLLADGSILVADAGNHRIRKMTLVNEPVVAPIEVPSTLTVLHGATFREEPVAPGEIIAIFGSSLGPPVGVLGKVVNGLLETQVGGTQVLVDGQAAPLFYVQEKQVNLQVPYSVAGKQEVEIVVTRNGSAQARTVARVAPVVPGLLTAGGGGSGQAVAAHENGTLNSSANPARAGSGVVLYATGDGQLGADAVDGKPAGVQLTTSPVRVEIAGKPAAVLYAGRAPGYVGLMQINVRIPELVLPTANLDVRLYVNNEPSQTGVTLAVR